MNSESRVTLHMVASLDGFIARKDGAVDWLESSDEFPDGMAMDPEFVEAFLKTIDCYIMGSQTYETAVNFEAKGFGWAYGEKPVVVLTRRKLHATRKSIEFYAGDLTQLVNERLRMQFRQIWIAGGADIAAQFLRLRLVDEIVYSIHPILIGTGIPFFRQLDRDLPLHLIEMKAYKNGMVELRYQLRYSGAF